MNHHRFSPKLCKKRILSHADFTVYSVNGLSVRNVAQPDEEFGNFATRDEFPNLIPRGEIWISEKLVEREGVFFIANALTQMKRQKAGISSSKAYDDGLEVEQVLREKLNGVEFRAGKPHKQVPDKIYLKHYFTVPDLLGPVKVWLVDGNLVRSYYKTDYTEGGHGYVYPWVPKPEIWVEDGVDHRELHFITIHEYLERRLMRDAGLEYDPAHEICSKVEFEMRKSLPIKQFLASGSRKIHKGDLSKLARQDFFDYVVQHYVKK